MPGCSKTRGEEIRMALKQLTEEQIRTWSIAQKDRWWFDNIYKGDMPQLTVRSALTGMILGGLLSLTNLYVGAKTGWTLGVGITSVILAFAMWKVFARFGLKNEFSMLENNCMQSIATSAGYMTAPLISSLAAYMMVTNTTIPMWAIFVWLIGLAVLGVLFAFPLKRRFINDEQHPFPEGRAAGVVMDALHTGEAADGLLKAKLLVITGGGAALIGILKSSKLLGLLKAEFLTFPETLDGLFENLAHFDFFKPFHALFSRIGELPIGGVPLRDLTVQLDSDVVMIAAGGLMGIRTGVSIMVGAVINYLILAPIMINRGDIIGKAAADGTVHYGFKAITLWGLWAGVAMMTTASLFSFFSKPQMILASFKGLMGKKVEKEVDHDILKDIELPMKVFVIGIPVVGLAVVLFAHAIFDVELWLGLLAIPLVFVFTLIAASSTALTSITPTGALGKLTQLTYGALAPGNITTNLMTAGITGEVASNASNLLMDIKPGYMLGAKPRQQAVGHVLGILAGASVAVPIFFMTFMHNGPQNLVTDQYPMPAATIWRAVAEILTTGLSNLSTSAQYAALIGAIIGIVLEAIKTVTKGKFWLSGVGIGLATVIPFNTCLAMFIGSFIFWLLGRMVKNEDGWTNRVLVKNMEPICAGVIAGGALTGILVMILETFVIG
ncbi:MAG: hypothetical protein CO108_30600 [Deltaproteobacteria bacterium CG_4_9_14_3_um_filter_63_12]|nr:MAG: hypothetical protein CO108_30600 [Deltaproteobacteria bacterium CG_4_9_14_3_um_filter_63_12]